MDKLLFHLLGSLKGLGNFPSMQLSYVSFYQACDFQTWGTSGFSLGKVLTKCRLRKVPVASTCDPYQPLPRSSFPL